MTALLTQATTDLLHRVDAVPAAAWPNDSPCGIPVGEVIDHLVAGNIFATRLLAGATAAEATADLDTPPVDRREALRTTCAAQLEAFTQADRTRLLHHPSRDIDYETFVRFRLGELIIHGWDITTGAGLATTLDPSLTEGLWPLVEPHLEEMRAMGTYGPTLTTDQSPEARLLAAYGRTHP